MAERRVVYVGGIPDSFAPSDLRRRFDVFGTIVTTSVHFRERGYVCTDLPASLTEAMGINTIDSILFVHRFWYGIYSLGLTTSMA